MLLCFQGQIAVNNTSARLRRHSSNYRI